MARNKLVIILFLCLLLAGINACKRKEQKEGPAKSSAQEIQVHIYIAAEETIPSLSEVAGTLEAVDYVLVFSEETPHAVLEKTQPDLLVKGGTYGKEGIVGWEYVESYGGEAKPLGVIPGRSSTSVIEKIKSSEANRSEADIVEMKQNTLNQDQTDRKAG